MNILSIICVYFPSDEKSLFDLAKALRKFSDVTIVINGGKLNFDADDLGLIVIDNGINYGTLAAYNYVVSNYPNYSHYWLWNQDTQIGEDALSVFLETAKQLFNDEKVAGVTVYDLKNFFNPLRRDCILVKESTTLLDRHRVSKLVDYWFDEQLFMDHGDWDLSYRIFRGGGRIKQIRGININHALGDPEKTFFGYWYRPSLARLHMQGINLPILIKKYKGFNFIIFLLLIRTVFILPFKNLIFDQSWIRNKTYWSGLHKGVKGFSSKNYIESINRKML